MITYNYTPLISIVLLYRGKYEQLLKTLAVINNSTERHIGVVIVDISGAQTVQKLDIFQYECEIKYVYGRADEAITTGISHATAPIIMVHNADIYYSSNLVEYVCQNLQPDSGLVFDCYQGAQQVDIICATHAINIAGITGITNVMDLRDYLTTHHMVQTCGLYTGIREYVTPDYHSICALIRGKTSHTVDNTTNRIVTNYNLKGICAGIGITTFSDAKTSIERVLIIDTTLASLKKTVQNTDIIVVIVVDGSCIAEHKRILDRYATDFDIIYKPENRGIWAAKNTCIKYLMDRGVDIGFLADDDVKFYDGWYRAYIAAILSTQIQHFTYCPSIMGGMADFEITAINGYDVKKRPENAHGCFITFTRSLIDQIRYFKEFAYKYGHEHCNFTERCIKYAGNQHGVYDIVDCEKYVELNALSMSCKSMVVDYAGWHVNAKIRKEDERMYEPFLD